MLRIDPIVPAESFNLLYFDSPQLAILTAPSVIDAVPDFLTIGLGLAADTQMHTGHRAAARLGDFDATFFAVAQALSPRQLPSRTIYGVFHAGVDLVLHCPVFSPAACHNWKPLCLAE